MKATKVKHSWPVSRAGKPDGGDARPGQALLWVAIMLPLFLAIVGLAIDGGTLFAERRRAQNAADAAARAGAQQIDVDHYRATGKVLLDQGWARYEARRYLAALGEGDASVNTTGQQVTVAVRRDVRLSFLKLVGVGSVAIDATAVAEPFYGIDAATR